MSVDAEGRPTGSVLTSATVIVMNKGEDSSSGQDMLAISPGGCFYFEGGDNLARVMSLNDVELFIKRYLNLVAKTEQQVSVANLILSTIATCKSGSQPS